MNEFVIQLDEEVEGMQATICALQEQLKAAKSQSDTYEQENRKLKELYEMHSTTTTNNTSNDDHIQQMDIQSSTSVPQLNSPPSADMQEQNEQTPSEQLPQMSDTNEPIVQLQRPSHEEQYVEIKEEYLDERTIHPSSNGDSNMSNTSDELPMETEPSITLPQKDLRTVEGFNTNRETVHHLPPINHVKVICGENINNSTKDVESTPLHSFVSPPKGIKTSFSINDLLSSSRTDSMKKASGDVTMDALNGETAQHTTVPLINGQIDDGAV